MLIENVELGASECGQHCEGAGNNKAVFGEEKYEGDEELEGVLQEGCQVLH